MTAQKIGLWVAGVIGGWFIVKWLDTPTETKNFNPSTDIVPETDDADIDRFYKRINENNISRYITQVCRVYKVPEKIMLAICLIENGGRTDRIGSAGEIGAFQIMPYADKCALGDYNNYFEPKLTVSDLHNIFTNTEVAAAFLCILHDRFNLDYNSIRDIEKLAVSYNGGNPNSANAIRDYLPKFRDAYSRI